MSYKPPNRNSHRSPQEKLLSRVNHAQNRRERNRDRDCDLCCRLNYQEEQEEAANAKPTPHRSSAKQVLAPTNLSPTESYDVIHLDEKPATVAELVNFDELYGQDIPIPVPRRSSEKSRGKPPVQRSRSVPPCTSETNCKLGASFPCDSPVENTSELLLTVEEEILEECAGTDNLIEKHSRQSSFRDENAQSRTRSSTSKKVSYAKESRAESKPMVVSVRKQSSPVQSRFRTECIETDESDISFTAIPPAPRKSSRPPSPSNRTVSPAPPVISQALSERSFKMDTQSIEDFVNKNSRFKVSSRYSQDSIPGEIPSNTYHPKDVLPLPIEIPDNVADIEAFRRYLSVRRGALTPVRQFEKRNQSCPSYESIGRRPRKPALGLTSNCQLEPEAGKRTSSLSHAIMTLALLSASICQLRFLITYSHAHTYPILNYFLVFTSIILEIAAGIGYVLIARCSYDDAQSEAIHNYLIFALFIVAISNVILAAFAFDDHLCDEIKRINSRTSVSSTASEDQFNQPVPRADRVMDSKYMPLE